MAAAEPPLHQPSAADGALCCSQTTLDSHAVLALVLGLLPPRSLVQCRLVNTLWHAVASDPQVRRASFLHHFGLLGCHGAPRSPQFYDSATLASFCRQHAVGRNDSLTALAVRHNVSVHELKRLNLIMTDHSLHSRTHVYTPVPDASQLSGRLVRFVHDGVIKRELAVLLGGAPQPATRSPGQQQSPPDEQQQQQQCSDDVGEGARPRRLSSSAVDALQAKLTHALGRSLLVDADTASFYLQDAGGDMKAAMQAFAEDVAWEGRTAGPIRTAPVQRWISGEHHM